MSTDNLIVISIDGLRASALGAYGNTWHQTPAFDALAAQSTVCSQLLAEHWAPEQFWSSVWGPNADGSRQSLPSHALELGWRSLLVTDDATAADLDAASGFETADIVPPSDLQAPADSVEQTAAAATLSALLEAIELTPGDRPLLAWAHLRFAAGPWDAPLSLVDDLRDDDDPEAEPSLLPPSGALADLAEPDDARFLATLRYSAQVVALDRCLGIVLQALPEVLEGRPYRLAVLGTRGFALGEHGRLGDEYRPYNECRQLPVLLHRSQEPSHARRRGLLTNADLPALLLGEEPSPRKKVILHAPKGGAVQDEHWKLCVPSDAEPELYSKPDDTWEMNDVAVRHRHEVEELQAALTDASTTANAKPA
ncbi:hypothetical protein Pla123a_27040 [Posidoniimonas polymericola]|uniref:Sulfatase n=1 Tax=Posidoniimonas polymericola TaxID=2528002 RepID=A0A5C5YM67_9BACT|nr:hypothetical protein [Posidoniimonas polymericola]TWT75919.1 hypothetical protein Pla123a_27040 [Posidoniimonas polymericola]